MKTNNPLVSVIIPTYGRADLLGRAINSVLNQTYENIEIVVINDNLKESPHFNATIDLMKNYITYPNVILVADGINRGGSLARNKGIEICLGQYITFLDDDDYYYPNKVQMQIDHLITDKIDVSVCGMDKEKNGIVTRSSEGSAIIGEMQNFILRGRAFTPMIFAKREVLELVGGFTYAKQFQDHILMIKILEKGFVVKELDENLFVHNNHEDNRITTKKINIENYTVRRKYEEKNLHLLDLNGKKKYLLNMYLLNGRYYRDNKNLKQFFKEIFKSISYISGPSDFLNVIKVSISYLIK